MLIDATTNSSNIVNIDTSSFFGLAVTARIRRNAHIYLSEQSYLPKIDNPRSDWVASVAVPAFLALSQSGVTVNDFCTIGTGAGLDALAAIEIFGARNVIVTDLHDQVVQLARKNIVANTLPEHKITVFSGAGDLLDPIQGEHLQIDLLYENLPNIPLFRHDDILTGQNSSTFISDRKEHIPHFVENYLIALHYLALKQSYALLRPQGRVLSSIGGRIPLDAIVRLGRETGYTSEILTYTWKVQSEPEEVIGGYAQWEQGGRGPFHFYPASVLAETFGSIQGCSTLSTECHRQH